MNRFEVEKYWDPKKFWFIFNDYTKQELRHVLWLLKKKKISLEEEE